MRDEAMSHFAEGMRSVRFGTFDMQAERRELRKDPFRIKLQEQPFQVLSLLLQKRRHLVTGTELPRRLGPKPHCWILTTALHCIQ